MKKFIAIIVLAAAPALFAQETSKKADSKTDLKSVELKSSKQAQGLSKDNVQSLRSTSKVERTKEEREDRKQEMIERKARATDQNAKSLK
jgi:hypothetical protein